MKLSFLLSIFAALTATVSAVDEAIPEKIEFNRDVRPILSENCFKCHGFDPKHREGKRRFDTLEGALADNEGVKAIVPGHLAQSEIHVRIRSTDQDEMMPPPKAGKKITDRQRAILDRWIAKGAVYQPHWAYIVPSKPPVPSSEDVAFIKNPIDAFVLARHRELGLQHAPEADRIMLLRRLSFDLTGLPPSKAEVDAFVADRAPDAYEKRVRELLASPAFGERLAVYWLDLVRYADSIGFQSDNPRNVWPYRDYVIRSFNENKPFDQFTIEQLAGDLLPDSTPWQKVASGFNRLNLTTQEVGAQARDYEARTVADRVRAIGTVWLAQTTGCCQCHDHKFDPITARDFYRLGAFFADINESAIGLREEGMPIPTPEEEEKFRQIEARIAATHVSEKSTPLEIHSAEVAWEHAARDLDGSDTPWQPVACELQCALASGEDFPVEQPGGWPATQSEGAVEACTVRLNAKLSHVTGFRIEGHMESAPAAGEEFDPGSCTITLAPAKGNSHASTLVRSTVTLWDTPPRTATNGSAGKEDDAHSVAKGQLRSFYFDLEAPLSESGERALVFTLSRKGNNQLRPNGFRVFATTAPGLIRAPLTGPIPQKIAGIIKTPEPQRSLKERDQMALYFRQISPSLGRDWVPILRERRSRTARIPRCLVSESMPEPRTVRVLPRGNWQDESGEIVEPGLPAFFPRPQHADSRRLTRLDLARWIASRENPLTARVFVNRLWKLFFGSGLSKTLDDFGAQGEPPMNPELLDWLACEFMDSGWDIKHMANLMVSSSVYRQSSKCSAELRERDPENRELARQSRFRLDAEFIRDNALAISGLLVRTIGGPSVNPYQPPGYWENLNFPEREWHASTSQDQWRRGLYTWWQRSYMHPSLLAFDAPAREECTAERTRSNIPQQALALLNDPTYVEAARAFAARILREGGAAASDRLTWAFGEALSRSPRRDEIQTLSALLEKQKALLAKDPASAEKLVRTGFLPLPKNLDIGELAAWTNIARVILNLHETITRF